MTSIKYVSCRPNTKTPKYASTQDSGADIYVNFSGLDISEFLNNNPDVDYRDLELEDGSIKSLNLASECTVRIPTGLKVLIPQDSIPLTDKLALKWGIQVRPKSGLAYNSCLTITNTPGTIDA